MNLTVYFKHFDPLAGKLPERYDYLFVEIAARARKLLSNRNVDEIHAAAKILTMIHRAPGFVDPLADELKQPTVSTILFGKETELVVASNEVEALHKNIANVSLAEYSDFPNAAWYELFAVLTLSYMEKICGAVYTKENWQPMLESKWLPGIKQENPFPKPTEERIDQLANDSLLLAKQAITYAEMLHSQGEVLRSLRAQESSNAAKKRHHDQSGPLKAAVIECYQQYYQSRSNRDAARRVFADMKQKGLITYDEASGKLMHEGKVCLQTDEPEKRFEIWIGQFKKEK